MLTIPSVNLHCHSEIQANWSSGVLLQLYFGVAVEPEPECITVQVPLKQNVAVPVSRHSTWVPVSCIWAPWWEFPARSLPPDWPCAESETPCIKHVHKWEEIRYRLLLHKSCGWDLAEWWMRSSRSVDTGQQGIPGTRTAPDSKPALWAVLRIRDVYPGSWIWNFPSRIQGSKRAPDTDKEFKYF